jgi:aminopeptidase N
MKGMKKSLDYFSKNFSPYQYQQMRIMEFPRYEAFAQSFPNTIPFSEGSGFVLDIDDEKDIDMAFFITAHEVAHQWWGFQVNAANVQGKSMISETLAQYSALMVLKDTYPQEKVQQLLQQERKRYLNGRPQERTMEMPLSLVESGQRYIRYGKGLVNMYAFQDYISEEKVNLALQRFIKDWNCYRSDFKQNRLATTNDLLGYFREVTPDSLQYIIHDLFETITLYDLQVESVLSEQLPQNNYKTTININALKYRAAGNGKENEISVNDWIDIGVYGTNKQGKETLIYLKKHKITSKSQHLEIIVDQLPVKVGIDPLNKLIDRKPENNIKKISVIDS